MKGEREKIELRGTKDRYSPLPVPGLVVEGLLRGGEEGHVRVVAGGHVVLGAPFLGNVGADIHTAVQLHIRSPCDVALGIHVEFAGHETAVGGGWLHAAVNIQVHIPGQERRKKK